MIPKFAAEPSEVPAKKSILGDLFGIDGRSLGLFRIGIALVLLYDLAVRCVDIEAFYTDAGVWPRGNMMTEHSSAWISSFHLIGGTVLVETLLFMLHAACAIGLLLGYRTRWMTFFSWLLLASLQRRNPFLFSGADNYLRMMLFWGMFLPLGIRYSLDNLRRPQTIDQGPVRVISWGTIAILLQTFCVYFFSALYKWQGDLWREGTALFYAFHIDLYAQPLALHLNHFPLLLKAMTYFVLVFETVGPFLLFFPFFTILVRTVTVFVFILMQTGFTVLLYLDLFPAVSIASMILFLPTSFWNRWLPGRTSKPRPTFEVTATPFSNITAAFFLIFVVCWLLTQIAPAKFQMPKGLRNLASLIYLEQQWKMFAPNPARAGGWLVAPGTLQDGSVVDLSRNGEPLSWERPRQMIKNERWRKYFIHLVLFKNENVAEDYAPYLCKSWNAKHEGDKALRSLEIDIMTRLTVPQDPQTDYTKQTLLHYECAGATTVSKQNKKN